MSDLTTAQRLAAYRDELIAAGFAHREVWELVENASPTLPEDLRVRADERPDIVAGEDADWRAQATASWPILGVPDPLKEVNRLNAQRDVRLIKRSMRVEGDGIRIEDEFSDGKGYAWNDLCNRIEVDFSEDGSTGWTTSYLGPDADA